jgi:hypothetical protein
VKGSEMNSLKIPLRLARIQTGAASTMEMPDEAF